MKRSVELMSPVGSYEALMATIKAGCNSVYFGVEQLYQLDLLNSPNFR
ncbi:MAG: hypothetical protein RIT41_1673 [Bacteroidota bacterium]